LPELDGVHSHDSVLAIALSLPVQSQLVNWPTSYRQLPRDSPCGLPGSASRSGVVVQD
jgi:hypothetical protein